MTKTALDSCPQALARFDRVIESRQSIRAFTSRPVPRDVLETILQLASRAPSGANLQPWKTYIVQGKTRESIIARVCAAHDAVRDNPQLAEQHREPFAYYPCEWFEPYLGRRRENGWGLYGLLGIRREEKDKMHAQHQRNFHFFDAPVGLVFTTHQRLGHGALIDMGGFMQTLMLAARARGLDTCPQAAWNFYQSIILDELGADADEMVVCGMALGWADQSAKVNTFRTPREPVDSFTVWRD